jgi:hypothetical protein
MDYPIKIICSAAFLEELSASECGSYEDMEQEAKNGGTPDRPLATHTHIVAQRFKTRLVLKSYEEVEDVYYSVSTGTCGLIDGFTGHLGFLPSCQRVADKLQAIVQERAPEIARYYPTGM